MEKVDIVSMKPKILKWEVTGKIDDAFENVSTQYGYKLAPYHPEHKIYFICISQSKFIFSSKDSLLFSADIAFQIDNAIHKPTIVDLLSLANAGVSEMNKLLNEKANQSNLEIAPLNPKDTISSLEECLLLAYPEN